MMRDSNFKYKVEVHEKEKLTVVIPFRCENKQSEYLLERIEGLIKILPQIDAIEYLVVDSGSSEHYSDLCKRICQNNVRYIYHDSTGKTFSLSKCRDYGVQHAKGQAITFLDVDLRMRKKFWYDLLELMESYGISDYKKKFLAIPCLYLSAEGTKHYELNNQEELFQKYYLEYLQGNNNNVENFAACSSMMVVDRLHYLSIGGHNPEFSGHGYEDFELYHRLMIEENLIPKSRDYNVDTKDWKSNKYLGFRSQLSICARPALLSGLYIIHLWHPRPKQSSFYQADMMKKNRQRLIGCFDEFEKKKNHPAPLVDENNKFYNKSLLFTNYNGNLYRCMRNILPMLGDIVCQSEFDFIDVETGEIKDSFFNYLKLNEIDLIIFPNPYGSEARIKIYYWCRTNKFPYICFERGALPDSWYLDNHGFNADSISYVLDYSNVLDENDKKLTINYINQTFSISSPLEQQGLRIGAEALIQKLGIQGQKILFVPLQRPSDTVIKYFVGDVGSYDNFILVIDKLAGILKGFGWVTLVKKHPLETEAPIFANARIVDQDTHFLDLVEASDSCALINSGVGVYSMMAKKPCYVFGDAFYDVPDVTYKVSKQNVDNYSSLLNLAKEISSLPEINSDNMLKYIHHLVTQVYSFGNAKVMSRKEKDGSFRTITTDIDFYDIKLNDMRLTYENNPNAQRMNLAAPIFERFALDIAQNKDSSSNTVKNKAQVIAKPTKNGSTLNDFKRKYLKLRNKPYDFFNDSKNKTLKKIRVIFE